jgi:hypothetical protein
LFLDDELERSETNNPRKIPERGFFVRHFIWFSWSFCFNEKGFRSAGARTQTVTLARQQIKNERGYMRNVLTAFGIAILISATYAGLVFFIRGTPFDKQLLADAALVFAPAVIIELVVAVVSLTRRVKNLPA